MVMTQSGSLEAHSPILLQLMPGSSAMVAAASRLVIAFVNKFGGKNDQIILYCFLYVFL
jgi:hypothetical protein